MIKQELFFNDLHNFIRAAVAISREQLTSNEMNLIAGPFQRKQAVGPVKQQATCEATSGVHCSLLLLRTLLCFDLLSSTGNIPHLGWQRLQHLLNGGSWVYFLFNFYFILEYS